MPFHLKDILSQDTKVRSSVVAYTLVRTFFGFIHFYENDYFYITNYILTRLL